MEYFTRQITLQDRLKQHEYQLYPLFGSCLELRDDSPKGQYQGSPLDLRCNSLAHAHSSSETISKDTSSSFGNDGLVIPTDQSSFIKTISVYQSSSPATSTQIPTDKSLSPGSFPENSDTLNVKSALIRNDERGQLTTITAGEKCSPGRSLQPGEPTRGIIPTRPHVHNPLLKEVLECENPTVSAVSLILEHGKHVNELNSSSDPDNMQCKSTISNDDHERKQSDSTMTSYLEHKSPLTNEQENKKCAAPMTTDNLPISSNPATHGVTNPGHERLLQHANSRKRRRFLSGAMQAFLSNRRQNHSKLCPNVNVADFTDQCAQNRSGLKLVNESNLPLTQYATNCRQPRPPTDLNVSMKPVDVNHKDISSQGHYGNQTPSLDHYRTQTPQGQYGNQTPSQDHYRNQTPQGHYGNQTTSQDHYRNRTPRGQYGNQTPSQANYSDQMAFKRHYNNLMSSQGYNSHEVLMPEEPPVAINNLAKQCEPPSSHLINGVNPNLYPCSRSNTQSQEQTPSTYSKVQQHEKQYCPQQIKETVHPSSDTNKHLTGLLTPLDLSTKREHVTHDSDSVSEETRIKEISNNLRLKLLEQSSIVPYPCPGICLGHAVDPTKVKMSAKCIPSSRHTERLPIDQTSIIIERQVLLNLDYQHLLNSDEDNSVDPDQAMISSGCFSNDTETKSKNRTVRYVNHQGADSCDQRATDQEKSSATDQERSSATDKERSLATDQERSLATDKERSLATDQERSSATDQESHNISPDVDRTTRKEVSSSSAAQVKEQIVTSVSTHMDGSQDQSSMAWNLSVSKTIGLHSDCNNCKACRRIFAKLSIPPIEQPHVPHKKQTKC